MATMPGPGRTPGGRATVSSVAARAGVSRQTVSNVLHTPHIVQPSTRDRVLAAIAELDYRPNLAARQMRTARSQAVAVRIHPTGDGVNSVVLERFMHALCAAAEQRAFHLVVFTAEDDAAEVEQYRHLRSTLNIDGFVLVGTHADDDRVDWLLERAIPFVAFGRPWVRGDAPHASRVDERRRHPWVDVNGAAGTEKATRELQRLGHTRIAFLGWEDSAGVGDDRELGWRRAMATTGGSDLVVLRGSDTLADGVALAGELLRRHPDVTAAVCVSDSIAIGAAQAQAADARLALVGFDDTATAQALGLSSVAQPLGPAAERCFELLYEHIHASDGEPHLGRHELLPPEVRLRTLIPCPRPGPHLPPS